MNSKNETPKKIMDIEVPNNANKEHILLHKLKKRFYNSLLVLVLGFVLLVLAFLFHNKYLFAFSVVVILVSAIPIGYYSSEIENIDIKYWHRPWWWGL